MLSKVHVSFTAGKKKDSHVTSLEAYIIGNLVIIIYHFLLDLAGPSPSTVRPEEGKV